MSAEALRQSSTCTCTEILLQLRRSRGWTSKCHFPGAQTVFPRHLTFSIETHLLVSPAKQMENLRRLKTKKKKEKDLYVKAVESYNTSELNSHGFPFHSFSSHISWNKREMMSCHLAPTMETASPLNGLDFNNC